MGRALPRNLFRKVRDAAPERLVKRFFRGNGFPVSPRPHTICVGKPSLNKGVCATIPTCSHSRQTQTFQPDSMPVFMTMALGLKSFCCLIHTYIYIYIDTCIIIWIAPRKTVGNLVDHLDPLSIVFV